MDVIVKSQYVAACLVPLSVAFSSPMFSFLESDGFVSVCANLSVSGAATSDSDLEVEVEISDGKSSFVPQDQPRGR